jgi:hypothetical protein
MRQSARRSTWREEASGRLKRLCRACGLAGPLMTPSQCRLQALLLFGPNMDENL